jgi:hypothetical protein
VGADESAEHGGGDGAVSDAPVERAGAEVVPCITALQLYWPLATSVWQ